VTTTGELQAKNSIDIRVLKARGGEHLADEDLQLILKGPSSKKVPSLPS